MCHLKVLWALRSVLLSYLRAVFATRAKRRGSTVKEVEAIQLEDPSFAEWASVAWPRQRFEQHSCIQSNNLLMVIDLNKSIPAAGFDVLGHVVLFSSTAECLLDLE